jgi:hypothetical protein
MAVASETIEDANKEGTLLEKYVNSHVGNFIHFFLTVLAVMVMVAACIALFQITHHGFSQLWRGPDEYQTLHQLLQSILLLAIAGELALLLLFHRATAAVEVVMFVIARRMVATDVTAFTTCRESRSSRRFGRKAKTLPRMNTDKRGSE